MKAIIIQVYDKGHTIFSSIKFESDVQAAKNWDIKIVSYDNLKYGITVIFELNTPKYLR